MRGIKHKSMTWGNWLKVNIFIQTFYFFIHIILVLKGSVYRNTIMFSPILNDNCFTICRPPFKSISMLRSLKISYTFTTASNKTFMDLFESVHCDLSFFYPMSKSLFNSTIIIAKSGMSICS